MNPAIIDIFKKHDIEAFEIKQNDGFIVVVKTNPPPSVGLIEDILRFENAFVRFRFETLIVPEKPYLRIGVASENIPAGAEVEWCCETKLARRVRG